MARSVIAIDTRFTLTGPDGPILDIPKIENVGITFESEILEEHHIGDVDPEYTDVTNGVSLKWKFNLKLPGVLDYIAAIQRRQRREDLTTRFGAGMTINFPEGGRRRIIVPNLAFAPIALNAANRKEFVTLDMDAKASAAFFKR